MAHKILAFIKPPLLKLLALAILVVLLYGFSPFFKSSQHRPPPHTEFLKRLMIKEWGLYTLLGSKPVTLFEVENGPPETEEQLFEHYEAFKTFLKEAEQQSHLPLKERTANNPNNITLPKYKNYKKDWQKIAQRAPHPKRLWESWTDHPLILDPKYLIFSRKTAFGDGRVGVFVNIPNLVWTLYNYQEEFSTRTDISFNPEAMVYDIQDDSSLFWKRVFKDHFLVGLICGYGQKNSFQFDWAEKHFPSIVHDKRRLFLTHNHSQNDSCKKCKKSRVKASDLPIPTFFYFGIDDPMHRRYSEERQKIVLFFEGKDLINTISEILQPPADP